MESDKAGWDKSCYPERGIFGLMAEPLKSNFECECGAKYKRVRIRSRRRFMTGPCFCGSLGWPERLKLFGSLGWG
jgi:hypothetical protein